MVAVAQQVAQGLLQLFPRVRQRHTDGAAAVDDLHGTGHRQLLRQPGDIALGIVDVVPRSRANTERVHHPLRHGFIHGHAAAQIPGSGVGHAQQIQRGLYAAVLAAASVQRQKYHVRHAAHGQHVLAQQAGALVPPAAAHRLQVRLHALHPALAAQAVRRVKDILQRALVVLQPQKHIHQNGLVSPLPQRPAHAGAAGQRHLALCGQSARQYHDLHKRTLTFRRHSEKRPCAPMI